MKVWERYRRGLVVGEGNLIIVARESTAYLRYRVFLWTAKVVRVEEVIEIQARLLEGSLLTTEDRVRLGLSRSEAGGRRDSLNLVE